MALNFLKKKPMTSPLSGRDAVLADLDGVVYAGPGPIPHAVESLNRAAESVRVGYITNNASRTDATVAAHLTSLGLSVQPSDVVTSPQAAMALLKEIVEPGNVILVVGGAGLVDELEKAGYVVTRTAEDNPVAVLQGFDPSVAWTDLAEAAFVLATREDGTELPWIATNTDWTIPQARGIAPGNGTLVSAVHTAVGRLATVAGKPEKPIFIEAMQRFGVSNPLFIGDRLDTDILGANRAGIASALVLTGIDRPKHLLAADRGSQPTFILGDLRELHEPYPATEFSKDGLTATVGDARVSVRGNDVVIEKDGDSALNRLRAACAVIWKTERAIWAFEVPERLFTEV